MPSMLLSGSSPQAGAGGAGPALNLGPCCLCLPGPSCLADIQYCCLHPGSSKAVFRCLSVLIWVFGRTSLSPLWVQVQSVLTAMAWTCVWPGSLTVALAGDALGPCQGEHQILWQAHLLLSLFFCVAEGLQEFWHPESSAPLLSCVGTGCHNADTLAAPTG